MKDYTVKTKSSSLLVKGITALAFPFAAQLTGLQHGPKEWSMFCNDEIS